MAVSLRMVDQLDDEVVVGLLMCRSVGVKLDLRLTKDGLVLDLLVVTLVVLSHQVSSLFAVLLPMMSTWVVVALWLSLLLGQVMFDAISMGPSVFAFDPPVGPILCATGVVVVCCVAVGSAASLEMFF